MTVLCAIFGIIRHTKLLEYTVIYISLKIIKKHISANVQKYI